MLPGHTENQRRPPRGETLCARENRLVKDSGFNSDTLAAGPVTLDRLSEVVLAFLQNSGEEAEVLTPSPAR